MKVPLLERGRGSQPPIHPSPFYLARPDENMYPVENPAVKATYFTQDPYCPFNSVETTINGQLKTTSILSSVASYNKEDDTIRLFLTMMFTTAFWWSTPTVMTPGLLLRLRREKEQRTMRFNQRITLRASFN